VFLVVHILTSLTLVFAQDDIPGKEIFHYVFPAFIEGTVRQKSGETNKALFNYNSVTEEMIFDQGGQQLALDKIENVDTVYIQNRKFVPFGNVFYEVATTGAMPLFIQHKTQLIPPGNNTGMGSSQTAAITNISDLKAAGLAYKLKLPDDYKVMNKTIYWLRKNNNYYIIKAEKNIEDLFPDKADAIKKYVKDNKVNFKNSQDLIKVVQFCNQ
ncbi:MAG: hypothetical protein M3040_17595, partial [Bacteroidota bacterium]|nr:hypothetical protein [Bacteroidota bacterium]